MKTSINIDDQLFKKIKSLADSKGLTFRAMVETGLHFILRENSKSKTIYQMPNGQFKGQIGFVDGASESSISSVLREMNDTLASSGSLPGYPIAQDIAQHIAQDTMELT